MFDGYAIRAAAGKNETWLVLEDLCVALKIRNGRGAVTRISLKNVGVATTDTSAGTRQLTIINEAGLDELIAASRKPTKLQLRLWLDREVLPGLPQEGSFAMLGMAPATARSATCDNLQALHDTNQLIQQQLQAIALILQGITTGSMSGHAYAKLRGGSANGDAESGPLDAAIRHQVQKVSQLQRQNTPGRADDAEQMAYDAILQLRVTVQDKDRKIWKGSPTIKEALEPWLKTVEEPGSMAQMIGLMATTWLNLRDPSDTAPATQRRDSDKTRAFYGPSLRDWLSRAGLEYIRDLEAMQWRPGIPDEPATL